MLAVLLAGCASREPSGQASTIAAATAHPVNPSPWYGFRIHSEAPRALELRFSYAHDQLDALPAPATVPACESFMAG